jgi:hypothetical protein
MTELSDLADRVERLERSIKADNDELRAVIALLSKLQLREAMS